MVLENSGLGTLFEFGPWRIVVFGYLLAMIILVILSRYYLFRVRRYVYTHKQGAGGSKLGLFSMPIIDDPVYNRLRIKMYGCYIGYAAMGVFALIIAAWQLLSFYQLPIDFPLARTSSP